MSSSLTDKPIIKLAHHEFGDELFINGKLHSDCPTNYAECPEDASITRGLLTPQLYIDGMKHAFKLAGLDIDDYVYLVETYQIDYEPATKEEVEEAREEWY